MALSWGRSEWVGPPPSAIYWPSSEMRWPCLAWVITESTWLNQGARLHRLCCAIAFADVNRAEQDRSGDARRTGRGRGGGINRFAVIHQTQRAFLPIEQVLDRGAFDWLKLWGCIRTSWMATTTMSTVRMRQVGLPRSMRRWILSRSSHNRRAVGLITPVF